MNDGFTKTTLYNTWKRLEMNEDLNQILADHNVTLEEFWNYTLPPRNDSPLSANSNNPCYCCSEGFTTWTETYRKIHGYASLAVCLFGTGANALNVAVLTRRELSAAPINRLLTWLAACDMLIMLDYVPFTLYYYFIHPGRRDFPYPGAVFILVHMHTTNILHTASIFLTLSLALWRYVAVVCPHLAPRWLTPSACRRAIIFSLLLPWLVCAPALFSFSIKAAEDVNGTVLYHTDVINDGWPSRLTFWVLTILIKLLPCILLSALSWRLVGALGVAGRRRVALLGVVDKRARRTTRMLLAVMALFLTTELPQAVLGLLSAILGQAFFQRCYHRLGEVQDMLALLNGSITFMIYCCMSRQFRHHFVRLFRLHNLYRPIFTTSTTQITVTTNVTRGSTSDVQTTFV